MNVDAFYHIKNFQSICDLLSCYRYDLVLGVATADSLVFGLSDKQLEYGVELEGRNQIISEFVAANYELHQREIFSAIVTEYTDWQSPTQHPASIRDKTLEALNDAQYVAPLVEVMFHVYTVLLSIFNFKIGLINYTIKAIMCDRMRFSFISNPR